MDLNDTRAELTGEVMRTWTGDLSTCAHAGIKFDPMSTAETSLINRFLVNQLQSDLPMR